MATNADHRPSHHGPRWAWLLLAVLSGVCLLPAVFLAAEAVYLMTADLPYEYRGGYHYPGLLTTEAVLQEPFTQGPRVIAWSCLPVLLLWIAIRGASDRGRRVWVRGLAASLVLFAIAAALLYPTAGKVCLCREGRQGHVVTQQWVRSLEMYGYDSETLARWPAAPARQPRNSPSRSASAVSETAATGIVGGHMPDAQQGAEVRAPSCWRDGLGCGVVMIGLLWLWDALLRSTSASYFLLPYIPYEDRWAYGFGDDNTLTRLVREPLSVAPVRIASACLPVFVLWGGARLVLGRRRETTFCALSVWLAAFLALSLALSLPLGRGVTQSGTWHDLKLKQTPISELMYLRDGELFRGGADPSGSAEATGKVRERPYTPSP